MSQIFRRPFPILFAIVIAAACGGKNGGQTSTPTAPSPSPTPTAPAPEPPTVPPATPPQPTLCSYAIAAEPDDYDRDGGNGALKINAAAGCKWSVKTDAPWAVVEGVASGEGTATLKVLVQPNEGADARKMSFVVENQSAVVSQPGQGDCTYQLGPVTDAIPRLAWSGEIAIVTSRGCSWRTTSDVSWLRLRSSSGTGSGKIIYDADFNPETRYAERRVATLAFRWQAPTAGENVRIYQWGSCNLAMYTTPAGLPAGITFAGDNTGAAMTASAAGGTFRLFVLTDPFMGCAWTVETSDNWVTLEFPRVHQVMAGDGDIRLTIPANTTGQSRRAAFVLDGKPLTITQAAK